MAKTKKVILFLVEGMTDKETLGFLLTRLIRTETVHVELTGGDITSRYGISGNNIRTKVWEIVKAFLNKNRYRKEDVSEIIHLIDTDGAFVSDQHVIAVTDSHLQYYEDCIRTNSAEKIKDRNHRKTENVRYLVDTASLGKIPYRIFYFSRNIEHVLHQSSGKLSDDEKIKLADKFVDDYEKDVFKFVRFLKDQTVNPVGDYHQSWDYILENVNSLKRSSNFGLFFKNKDEKGQQTQQKNIRG